MDGQRTRRRFRAAAAALILAAAGALAAEPGARGPALLDTATRLTMLAERVAKLHAQVGREVLVTRSRRALAEASGEFERGLREVSAAAPNAEIRDNYLLLRHLWDEYRAAALQAPTAEHARRLAERNEEVAWIAAKGARLLNEQSRSRPGDLVMAAGAARAAAQRLGKMHLQRGWAFPATALEAETGLAEAEVRRVLAELQRAPETGEAIALELRVAENQLALLRHAAGRLAVARERAQGLEHIAKAADNLVEVLDRAARSYAEVTSPARG